MMRSEDTDSQQSSPCLSQCDEFVVVGEDGGVSSVEPSPYHPKEGIMSQSFPSKSTMGIHGSLLDLAPNVPRGLLDTIATPSATQPFTGFIRQLDDLQSRVAQLEIQSAVHATSVNADALDISQLVNRMSSLEESHRLQVFDINHINDTLASLQQQQEEHLPTNPVDLMLKHQQENYLPLSVLFSPKSSRIRWGSGLTSLLHREITYSAPVMLARAGDFDLDEAETPIVLTIRMGSESAVMDDVYRWQTVWSIKKRIEAETQFPMQSIRLSLNMITLADSQSVAECGLKHGDELVLTIDMFALASQGQCLRPEAV
jgi:uncharacterized coiled-coil protein SlyX